MKIVDLTHAFATAMPVYPGDSPSMLTVAGHLGEDGTCPMFQLTTGMHVGTHLDAPAHVIPGGSLLSEASPEKFIGRGVLIDARGHRAIDAPLLQGVQLQKGDMILVCTGWSDYFHDPRYFCDFPGVTENFATALLVAGAQLLGLDTPSPDRAPYPIHRLLLGSGILLAENLTNLAGLLDARQFEVFALPLKIQAEAAPARILARVAA